MASFLSITEAAQRTGLSAHTLRYYERIGLLAPVGRATGGQRRYAETDLAWIGFLMRLRATGMTIQRMKAFALLRSEGDATIPARRDLLEQHLAEVLVQLQSWAQSAQVLRDKIAHYRQAEGALDTNPTTAQAATSLKEPSHDHQPTQPLRTGPRQTPRHRR